MCLATRKPLPVPLTDDVWWGDTVTTVLRFYQNSCPTNLQSIHIHPRVGLRVTMFLAYAILLIRTHRQPQAAVRLEIMAPHLVSE